MINIHIPLVRPRRAVVVAIPRPRRRATVGRRHYVAPVALEHVLPRVAVVGYCVPGFESIAAVGGTVGFVLDD